ncbi:MAG: hypothetical protein K2W33_09375 [Burkholderiales bacterium]|nr:hypothetical protein [Burkholderiales bacterium]
MPTWLCAVVLVASLPVAQAQDRIFRCGNEYTNSPSPAQKKDCKQIEGGNVTVVPATKPSAAASGRAGGQQTASADQPRVDPAQQKARDSDARAILEGELRRAEARLADLQREYNNGQPEKKTDELRNVARYQERVSELKASIMRAEADVTGIRRELQRAGGGAANASPTASTNTSAR